MSAPNSTDAGLPIVPIRHCISCGQQGHTNVSKSCPIRIAFAIKKESLSSVEIQQSRTHVSDIDTFFQKSSRNLNDATNKIRENVLQSMCSLSPAYSEHEVYGPLWKRVHVAFHDSLRTIATTTDVPVYTSMSIHMRGGRGSHYDAEILYHGEDSMTCRKIEFKYGGTRIDNIPQFLSLQAKFPLFETTYDAFWYDHYLDKYLACDTDITESKPDRDLYLKKVTSTSYDCLPFFACLKRQELFFQKEKNAVVNQSITDYLTIYGHMMNHVMFSDKVKDTQMDKHYLLWSNGAFYMDHILRGEMEEMSYHGIKRGNTLEWKSGTTMYCLLLRWRNHKGILNPAWQISMKRQ